MTLLKNLFVKPFAAKGPVWGTADVLIKLLAAFVWLYLMSILCQLMWESIQLDYNPITQLWWLAYCFLIFFGASWLAYIAIFMRDYNEEA
ncbi:MAG: hypothetical protein J6U96_02600 [Elusimicrobiaceae bacterium]|nr:hypothetical protein [Elusimicrobiaceae bacterium]